MQEYLVKCQDKWWHFFIKPFYGLCYRKRESGRFLNFEVLLADACEDFCAVSMGKSIHIVCQDKAGSIIYLSLDDSGWQHSVLLESKSPVPYPKHFLLIPVGNFLNLFYVITYQEKQMLVHQILGVKDRPPTVVDRVACGMPAFLAKPHAGTDISVFYKNESGVSGCRVFRWSRKEFGRFMPIHPELHSEVCAVFMEKGERIRYAASQKVETIHNLIYFEKTEEGDFNTPVTVNLDCPEDAMPVFWQDGERLYLLWRESGSVMSSHSTDDGAGWSKPVRYMKGTSVAPVLYTLFENGRSSLLYGFEKERDIVFYCGAGILDAPEKQNARQLRPAGYEVEDFVRSVVAIENEPETQGDPAMLQLKEEFLRLKEQFFSLRRGMAELTERVELIERMHQKESGGDASEE